MSSDSSKYQSIKLPDGQPIYRKIICYDFLNELFSNDLKVFTNPFNVFGEKLTFFELYVNALLNSNKATKSLKDKLLSDKGYASDVCKVSFMINVGRMNTTLAFYLEMKTNLRSYHPIPSLQKCENSIKQMGDSPRLKNIIKAVLLPHEQSINNQEIQKLPSTLIEVQVSYVNGLRPPTSITNFLFALMTSTHVINRDNMHDGIELHELIWPSNIPSIQKSKAFLWIVYNYLEKKSDDQSTLNPFDDDYSRQNPGKVPTLSRLSPSEIASENVDTEMEIKWGQQMQYARYRFLEQSANANTNNESNQQGQQQNQLQSQQTQQPQQPYQLHQPKSPNSIDQQSTTSSQPKKRGRKQQTQSSQQTPSQSPKKSNKIRKSINKKLKTDNEYSTDDDDIIEHVQSIESVLDQGENNLLKLTTVESLNKSLQDYNSEADDETDDKNFFRLGRRLNVLEYID